MKSVITISLQIHIAQMKHHSRIRSLKFSLDRIDIGIRKCNGDLKDPSQRPIIRIRNNDIKRVRSRATSATKARPPRFVSRIVCPGDECFSF